MTVRGVSLAANPQKEVRPQGRPPSTFLFLHIKLSNSKPPQSGLAQRHDPRAYTRQTQTANRSPRALTRRCLSRAIQETVRNPSPQRLRRRCRHIGDHPQNCQHGPRNFSPSPQEIRLSIGIKIRFRVVHTALDARPGSATRGCPRGGTGMRHGGSDRSGPLKAPPRRAKPRARRTGRSRSAPLAAAPGRRRRTPASSTRP